MKRWVSADEEENRINQALEILEMSSAYKKHNDIETNNYHNISERMHTFCINCSNNAVNKNYIWFIYGFKRNAREGPLTVVMGISVYRCL